MVHSKKRLTIKEAINKVGNLESLERISKYVVLTRRMEETREDIKFWKKEGDDVMYNADRKLFLELRKKRSKLDSKMNDNELGWAMDYEMELKDGDVIGKWEYVIIKG